MENRKRAMHFISGTAFVILIVLGLACSSVPRSAASAVPAEDKADVIDFTYPLGGVTNSVKIAGKDFAPVGIVFVNSEEKIDSSTSSAHTGSKITYEMFMREAARLGADDVINIKIDVKQVRVTEGTGYSRKTITTFMYTGTGLAIKYTDAIVINEAISTQDLLTGQ
jgi:uncharacterized protein YbjQ (UPF0145 family)